jgi:hypothetical protein
MQPMAGWSNEMALIRMQRCTAGKYERLQHTAQPNA